MHPLLFCSKTIRIKTHNGVPLGIIKEEKDLMYLFFKISKWVNSASKRHLRETRCLG